VSGGATSRDLLGLAGGLLSRSDPATAGLWPRAAALLARRALETAVGRWWEQRSFDPRGCPVRVQILCLRLSQGDRDLAARAGLAWSALSRACHHHAYDLSPTVGELRSWLTEVDALVERFGAA